MIKEANTRVPIKYLAPQESRMLIGIEVVPSHDPLAIVLIFQEKINQYCDRLHTSPLSPTKILASYNSYWWPSLKYIAPLLSLLCSGSIL